ncbi:MAG: hypothetical protein KC731_40725 [Myxococcales bacterium]|nr:hypothetical protein [Myxococcales bacterium]
MLGRRWVLAAALAGTTLLIDPTAPLSGVTAAEARVSIAHTLSSLVDASPIVVVATTVEETSRWEVVAGGKRIVTYSKVRLDDVGYAPSRNKLAAGKTLWIRRLGGAVGRIGQQVAGEAMLPKGEAALLFLTQASETDAAAPPGKAPTFTVVGAAQGHFRLPAPAVAEGEAEVPLARRKLAASRSLGKIVRRPGPVVTVQEQLLGRSLGDALALIAETKAARDAARDAR